MKQGKLHSQSFTLKQDTHGGIKPIAGHKKLPQYGWITCTSTCSAGGLLVDKKIIADKNEFHAVNIIFHKMKPSKRWVAVEGIV